MMHGFQANQQYRKKLGRESDWKACSSQANQWKKSTENVSLVLSLRSERFRASSSRKLGREQKKDWKRLLRRLLVLDQTR